MTNTDAERVSDIVANKELITGLTGMAVQLRRMMEGAKFVQDGFVRVRDPDYLIQRLEQAADLIEAQSKALAEAREALKPFVNVRDQYPESAALIRRDLDDLTPIAVTVTKGQFLTAIRALAPTPENPNG